MSFVVDVEETEVLPGQGLEDAVDQLRAMIRQEQTHYKSCPDYLKAAELNPDPLNVNGRWRDKICEWTFDVVDHFDFDRDVASIALDYLDRSVAAASEAAGGSPVTKREYQLYAVTCLYLAIKLYAKTGECYSDGSRKVLEISAFQELSRGFFTVETIEMMEKKVLFLLQWRLNPPVSSQFLAHLLRFLPRWPTTEHHHSYETVVTRIYEIAKYLSELCCCEASFAFETTPSFVAYGCLLCAFDAIQDSTPLPNEVIARFLCNVAVASEVLMPGLEQTMALRRKIKDLAPDLFPINQPTIARSVSIDEGDETSMAAVAVAAVAAAAATSSSSSSSSSMKGPSKNRSAACPTKISSVVYDDNTCAGLDGARKRFRAE